MKKVDRDWHVWLSIEIEFGTKFLIKLEKQRQSFKFTSKVLSEYFVLLTSFVCY